MYVCIVLILYCIVQAVAKAAADDVAAKLRAAELAEQKRIAARAFTNVLCATVHCTNLFLRQTDGCSRVIESSIMLTFK